MTPPGLRSTRRAERHAGVSVDEVDLASVDRFACPGAFLGTSILP